MTYSVGNGSMNFQTMTQKLLLDPSDLKPP